MKLRIATTLLCFHFLSYGQTNKLSADLNIGSTHPFSALSPDYYSNYFGLLHTDAGVRYMFHKNLGIKIDFGMDRFQNDNVGTNKQSLEFQTLYFRSGIQGVVNIGKILHYSDWTKRIGLLGHAGFGYAVALGDTTQNTAGSKAFSDQMFNLLIGFTPQLKITDKLALHGDLTLVSNINQQYNFDFKAPSANRYGLIANISIGGSYYIGKEKTHSDWDFKVVEPIIPEDTVKITRPDTLLVQTDQDTDKDGVSNAKDLCPQEPGLPELDGCPQPPVHFSCQLEKYPVLVFAGRKSQISPLYAPVIDSMARCMMSDPKRKLVIYGHADSKSDSSDLQALSARRAQQLKKEIVSRGVSPDRIFAIGQGDKKAALPQEDEANVKHNRVVYFTKVEQKPNHIHVMKSGEPLQGLFYTIQVGAFKKLIRNNRFTKYGEVLVVKADDGFIKYSVDIFSSYQDAFDRLRELKKNGLFQDAFIVPYFLGERISIQEAQELLNGNDVLEK
ncbi:MAG: flagellar motor protein MotB [Crocinitomicaceae bacterium]|jgi:OOP family OmpA-OmpF porin|nr:flagellar motor protein MotB [Crocinitomicaceae bacterium]